MIAWGVERQAPAEIVTNTLLQSTKPRVILGGPLFWET